MLLLLFLLLGATVIFLFSFVYTIGKTFVCVIKKVSSAKCIPTKSGSLRLSYWNIVPLPLEHCDYAIGALRLRLGHSGSEAFRH